MLCRPRMATAGAELSRNLFLLPLILSAVVVLWSEQLIREKGDNLPTSTVDCIIRLIQRAPPCGRCLTSSKNSNQILYIVYKGGSSSPAESYEQNVYKTKHHPRTDWLMPLVLAVSLIRSVIKVLCCRSVAVRSNHASASEV